MDKDFIDKTVIVTGAGGGIGRAIAEAFHKLEANVCITDISLDAAKETQKILGPKRSQVYEIDVTNKKSIEKTFSEIIKKNHKYEILASNAGVSSMNYVENLTEEEWDFNMNVNAKGIFLTNQAAIKFFKLSQIKGKIINTASLAAKVGAPLLAHYSASKFAVVGFTQALAREVAKDGIRVNSVCPGLVKTSMQDREVQWEASLRKMSPEEVIKEYIEMTPLGRLEKPEDVADVVTFLASENSRFMTGQAINVTGGIYTT
tara:strand:- start:967 stop:1746 length:780 start_codon:yes stop_codon:yes gene_type:complete